MKTTITICFICYLFLTVNSVFGQKRGLDAIDSLKKAVSASTKTDTNEIKTIFRITDAYIQISPDSALKYAQKGFSLSKQLNFKKGIAGFYNAFGMLYSDNGSFDNALKNYKESAKINEQIGNKRNLTATLNNIGTLYQRKGDYIKSLEYNFKALKLAEELNNIKLKSLLTSNIANIYFGQHDYQKALNYLLKALKDYEKIDDQEGQGEVNDKIGSVYHQQNQLNEAGVYYNRALKIFQSINNTVEEATVLSHIGLIYTDDLDKKLTFLIKAQQMFDATNPLYTISITNLGNIGGTYADIYVNKQLQAGRQFKNIPATYAGVAQKAEAYLNKAIAYSKQVGDVDNLSTFSENLAQLQEKKGDFKNAFYNYKRSRGIDDSLYSQESKNKIAELTAKYAFQKKEDVYKQQQQISDLKMKQIYLYAVLAVVVVSAILLFLLNRSRIGQLRLKSELQQKDAEEKTRELLHRNKLSESELKAIRSQMNPHFIFNVLNSIESYIMDNDPKMACRLVQKFATLSRIILENSTQSMVTAEREWKALQLYTELEAIRFNNLFTYSFEADPLIDLTALMLPPMLVQPLIENSIHHGLRNSPNADKNLSVKLEQTEHELLFTVQDNGIGINGDAKPKTSAVKNKSIGLAAIRERISIINIMNKDITDRDAEFKIDAFNADGQQGTIARLKLPKVLRNS